MAKLTPQTKKALALAYLLKASLETGMDGDFKLTALLKKCYEKLAYHEKHNARDYYIVCDDTFNMWKNLSKYHEDILTVDELSLFVEMLSSLISRSAFKEFFNMNPYKTMEKIRDERKSSILSVLTSIDAGLNEIFDTTPTATRESLGNILSKPIKAKKVKIDTRDKAVPKQRKKLRNAIKYRRDKNRNEVVA